MKLLIIISIAILLTACGEQKINQPTLQQQVDSLKQELTHTYKPGLGEFMSGIQVHHAKLWYAGEAQNWALAEFELGEITEDLEAIKEYCPDRPEVKSITMIDPVIERISAVIKKKDAQLFKTNFILLTNTCNNCHTATHHEFNVIKIPDTPPFSNQDFKVKN